MPKVRNIDIIFVSKKAASESIMRLAEFGHCDFPSGDLANILRAIEALDLTQAAATPAEKAVLHGLTWAVRFQYEMLETVPPPPSPDHGWGRIDNLKINVDRIALVYGIDRVEGYAVP